MVVFRWSATPIKMGGSQESWSTPPHHHRSSLNSNYRDSPVNSRNTSARSRLSVSSAQSPHCFLPTTRDSSPRSVSSILKVAFQISNSNHVFFQIPSPSLVPMRPDSSPDITLNELHHSPFSHTGSTPEPTEIISKPNSKVPSRRASYTTGEHQILEKSSLRAGFEPTRAMPIGFQVQLLNHSDIAARYPNHENFAPIRWVKETDIDDPHSIPTMSPIGSSGSSEANVGVLAMRSAPMSKMPSVEKLDNRNVSSRKKNSIRGYNNRSCRRTVLSGLDRNANHSPNGIYVRRSRSKDDRPSLSYMSFNGMDQQNVSPPRTAPIPIFMSQESVSMQSPMNSPVNHSMTLVNNSRNERTQSTHNLSGEELYKRFQQISLSHVQTLNIVADKLAEEARRGDEPVSRNRLTQLDFTSFIITSPHPILTKGKSLFYNAVLPRQNLPDYPVTLMIFFQIAPCSQYAPLMRKTESNHFGLPGFLEIEDHDGAIRQFLYDTGTQNLDGRNTKVIAMPRLNLCSFHSLAAHQLNQRMDQTNHEELVSFILLQVLQALKMLQGEGVESLSTNFKEFLLAYRYPNVNSSYNEFPRLLFLPVSRFSIFVVPMIVFQETLGAEIESGGDELVGLCRYALRALCTLLHHKMDGKAPAIKLRSRFSRALSACAVLLQEDKSNSLTKAKNVMELALWSGGEHFKNEQDARIWIDTARADCVDTLVSFPPLLETSRIPYFQLRQMIREPNRQLGARERFRVEFLLSSTPRSIMESQKATMAANVN
ncbi:Protein CBG08588 [Caenorhabditis briggsae]|uniref:Protein CBG08588 n=1 Tax=Caenorhabditis briggsae TaxID=6238 RepID=A8X721_CAEBR|nr:Protein CBG08588 [Caenorhabditis briggsae]CAP28432.2 Protein CBG08588 [Caenorhabditis briggsae]